MHLQPVIVAPAATIVLICAVLVPLSLAQDFDAPPDRLKDTTGETFEIAVSSDEHFALCK